MHALCVHVCIVCVQVCLCVLVYVRVSLEGREKLTKLSCTHCVTIEPQLAMMKCAELYS